MLKMLLMMLLQVLPYIMRLKKGHNIKDAIDVITGITNLPGKNSKWIERLF